MLWEEQLGWNWLGVALYGRGSMGGTVRREGVRWPISRVDSNVERVLSECVCANQ